MAVQTSIPADTPSDADLVTLYRLNADQEVLATLFLRYHSLVYGCCLKYLEDPELARDAVMDIYYELVEKLKTNAVEQFRSWLYVVSKNHCLMALRKQKKSPLHSFDEHVMQSEAIAHPEETMLKEQQLTRMEHCIEQLHADQRQTVRLFYLEQKCYHDITTLTGHDWNKVKSLIQNARRNLKICMEHHG